MVYSTAERRLPPKKSKAKNETTSKMSTKKMMKKSGAALPFFALACAASYLLSGYSSLYGAQRIVLDKWRIGE